MRYYLIYPVRFARLSSEGSFALGDIGNLACAGWWGENDIDAQEEVTRVLRSRPDVRACLREERYALFGETSAHADRYDIMWMVEQRP